MNLDQDKLTDEDRVRRITKTPAVGGSDIRGCGSEIADDAKSARVPYSGRTVRYLVIGALAVILFTVLRASSVSLPVSLADALLLVGAAYLSIYSLRLISSLGGLDIFAYAGALVLSAFSKRMREKTKSYYDYVSHRRASGVRLKKDMLAAGLAFLLPAVILTVFL